MLLILFPLTLVHALENGLGRTPAMGWNSWNLYACNINEDIVKSMADTIVLKGLKDVGYEYVNVDDCWQSSRNSTGHIQADPAKFPSGMKALADYVHSKGLKFGLYSSAGTLTCQGKPGGLGYETIDALSYASWGVDFLKYDNCNNQMKINPADSEVRYTAMRNALLDAGRPIYYSLCNWGQGDVWNWAGHVGNSWRTTGDIGDNFDSFNIQCTCTGIGCWLLSLNIPQAQCSITKILDAQEQIVSWSNPGGFNDMDMLEIGNGGMNLAQSKSHFSLWAALKSPLILGNDLTSVSADILAIISHSEIIAINQDPLGKSAALMHREMAGGFLGIGMYISYDIWMGPLTDGWVVVVFNRDGSKSQTISLDFSTHLNFAASASFELRDLWAGQNLGRFSSKISTTVPSHDVVVYKLTSQQ